MESNNHTTSFLRNLAKFPVLKFQPFEVSDHYSPVPLSIPPTVNRPPIAPKNYTNKRTDHYRYVNVIYFVYNIPALVVFFFCFEESNQQVTLAASIFAFYVLWLGRPCFYHPHTEVWCREMQPSIPHPTHIQYRVNNDTKCGMKQTYVCMDIYRCIPLCCATTYVLYSRRLYEGNSG